MNESVFLRVEDLLKQHGVSFEVLRHQAVFTSEEATAVGLGLDHLGLIRHCCSASAPECVSATNSA
jgi:hypothetical protein